MHWRQVEQTQWESFLAGFAREHDGWLVSVVSSDGTRHGRLRGVKLEEVGGVRHVVVTLTDGDTERLAVRSPTRILLDESAERAHRSLAIEGESECLRMTFRVAILPEMVDGIL